MAMTINGTNGVTFNDGTSMSTGQQAVKAWVNFNGTGTVAIRAAFNVSSITDNGVSLFRLNFTTAMPDANYALLGVANAQSGNNFGGVLSPSSSTALTASYADTQLTFGGSSSSWVNGDLPLISVAIFR